VTTNPLGSSREITLQRFKLRVLDGPGAGAEVVSGGDELAVGTAPGNHLVLEDPAVSRHHFVLTVSNDGIELRDVGSTNGTYVGGMRIKAAHLQAAVSITVGTTVLGFEPIADALHQALSPEERYGPALGSSPEMRRIFALLPRIAAADSTVLLEGETGTGKSLLAEAIHAAGPRRARPFMVVDCSAIPPSLIEAELFGHERGAFTGAVAARPGVFESGHGGTVFLDEIGELPLDMQPKLLRVLEDRTIRRLGSVEPFKLDVRVIAATNRDLRREVNKGAFRSDLFYRLNILRLRIPSLRERRGDIPILVAHFHEQFTGRPAVETPAALQSTLARQDWLGNVRELRSAVERAVMMGDPALWNESAGDPAADDGAPPVGAFDPSVPFRAAKERYLARWERDYVRELVGLAGGNVSRAARLARMDRNHLRELMNKYGVELAAGPPLLDHGR
jgi:two-component system response regulator GlrR